MPVFYYWLNEALQSKMQLLGGFVLKEGMIFKDCY